MGWTEQGQAKARDALLRKYGGEEGYKAEMRRRAAKGGKQSDTGGFAVMEKFKLVTVSSIGGSAKRRSKNGKKNNRKR